MEEGEKELKSEMSQLCTLGYEEIPSIGGVILGGKERNNYGRRSRQNRINSYSQVQPILIAKVIKLFFYVFF